MVTDIVRKPIHSGKKQEEEKNLETELQEQQDFSGGGNQSLDALFDAACKGYKNGLSRLLSIYEIVDGEVDPFLKNNKKMIALFMTLNFNLLHGNSDARGYARMSSISSMPDDYLAYLLNIDEKTIKQMDVNEKKELITSLPESSITQISSDHHYIIIHPVFLALSAEPEVRPLLGAALYLAEQAGEQFGMSLSNHNGWKKKFANVYIPTAYISEAAEKYGVSNDIYLKALQSFKKVKSRFIKN